MLSGGIIADSKISEAFIVMLPLTVIALWWATRVYRKAEILKVHVSYAKFSARTYGEAKEYIEEYFGKTNG
ncbi:MAG: hypothetical protein HPY66_1976 [Firmicutes bacterium]|nr:hypothetical protein [Bacillota bacterium]MDI6705234.1 hypothetical protein [Bacillota bacterium]